MQYASKTQERKQTSKRLPNRLLILFLRQLSMLLGGNIALDKALAIIQESGAGKEIQKTAEELYGHIAGGAALSEAMLYTGRFAPLLSAMARTGEESGTLPRILTNYTNALERQETTKKKIHQALMYPVLLTVVSICVVVFLLINVIPSFATLFSDAGMRLPLPTRILIAFSVGVGNIGPLFFLLLLGLFLLLVLASRTPVGKVRLHTLRRKIPFLGRLDRDIHTARLAELMALFFESNVDLLQFLDILAQGTKNIAERENLRTVHAGILHGMSVSDAFHSTGFYNPVFVSMLRVGEESGQISQVTASIAAYLDLDVQMRLQRATALLEPALILLLSFVIGFIVLAIAMPMFNMVNLYDL